MNELNIALYSQLQAGTALTALLAGTTSIYHLQAPPNATMPYVVYSLQAGYDENFIQSRMKNELYFIRAYSDVSAAQAGSIDAQIDSLLHGHTVSASGWSNFWTAREDDLENVETQPNGELIFMAGGLYRIRLT